MSLKETPVGGISSLQGTKVGVANGTTTRDILEKKLKESVSDTEIVTVDPTTERMQALVGGKIGDQGV